MVRWIPSIIVAAAAAADIAQERAPVTPEDVPAWAFPGPKLYSIPGTTRRITAVVQHDQTRAIDWFPDAHPAMPDAVRGRVVVALAALLSAASLAPAAAPDAGPPTAMEATSWHVPVIRNEYVAIFRVDIPGGRASNYHIHDRDQVCVVIEDYPPEAYSQPLGGPPGKPRQAARGEVSYVSYFGKPITHQAVNAGTLSNHSICTVFNEPKAAGFTVDAREAQSYRQLLDNDRVRAWRLVLKPGEAAAAITQRAPGLRVIIMGGQITEILPDGRERGMALRPGEFYWQPPGGTRGVRNIGTTPVEIVEYEFR